MYCQNNCSNNGFCNDSNGDCQCYDGFEGLDCSNKTCKNSCSTQGVCMNGRCYCNENYTGSYCEKSNHINIFYYKIIKFISVI